MSTTIFVKWTDAWEYMSIDFKNLFKHPSIGSTREAWADGRSVTYRTSSKVVRAESDFVQIEITYDRTKNNDLPKDALFGKSTISFQKPFREGAAEWEDDRDESENGTCTWKRSAGGLIKKKKAVQKTIRQLERKQAQFRALLLQVQGCCAFTGENVEGALEAAHIIPAAEGGAETEENGILLRADIHRLYDSGFIDINLNGQVKMNRINPSSGYYSLLKNARVSPHLLSQIKPALKKAKAFRVNANNRFQPFQMLPR